MLFASNGKAVRFAENEVRSMGRTATGVRGMRVAAGERVVSMIVVDGDGDILTASEKGFGKRTGQSEYPRKGRGTQGVIALQTSERNGKLVGAIQLTEHHEILLISDQGTLVRTRASEVSQVGRNTQGVTLMRVAGDEKLIAVERLDVIEADDLLLADTATAGEAAAGDGAGEGGEA
jgi:DNA gyrase subunit A